MTFYQRWLSLLKFRFYGGWRLIIEFNNWTPRQFSLCSPVHSGRFNLFRLSKKKRYFSFISFQIY